MKKILFIIILLTRTIGFTQINVFGVFVNQDGAFRQLDLKSDSSYIFDFGDRCGGKYCESGQFKVISDTIYLFPNDTITKPSKYLYISHLPTDGGLFWTWGIGTLARIFTSDSILPLNQSGRLTDYEGLIFGSFEMEKGYYSNGKISFKTENLNEKRVVTTYYSSGQVKSIELYLKNQKHGDWFYYSETGQLIKKEVYRRDRLKQQELNTL